MTVAQSDDRRKAGQRLTLSSAFFIIILIVLSVLIYPSFRYVDVREHDIFANYNESLRIAHGVNPYARLLESDMIHNDKYPTYLPLFYVLGAGVINLGLEDFDSWVNFWRWISLLCMIGIGLILFAQGQMRGKPGVGVLVMALWLFNRWTMHVAYIAHTDFLALLPFLLSLLLLDKRPRTAMLLYSVSLALKHIAILILPLFLWWGALSVVKMRGEKESLGHRGLDLTKSVALMGFIAFSTIGIVSLPFLIWDPGAFIRGLAFSVTRQGADPTPGLNAVLPHHGIAARLPLVIILLFIFYFGAKNVLSRLECVVLMILAFLGFNPVFFHQYMVWSLPFLLLLVIEYGLSARLAEGEAGTSAAHPRAKM
ncbi:MAG: hypothetical protein V2A74_01415 [bacterium]